MSKQETISAIAVTALMVLLLSLIYLWPGIIASDPEAPAAPGENNAQNSQNGSPQDGLDETGLGLAVTPGFKISFLTQEVSGARDLLLDSLGNIWVSRTDKGAISLIEMKDGEVANISDIFSGLRRPHGLALDPDDPFVLYFAQEDGVYRVRIYSEGAPEKLADLPSGGGHSTRSLIFNQDGRLFVSIGSSCNVCLEADARRAAIYAMDKDGGNFELLASGLRNSVFLTKHPKTNEIFATEMGRDLLGDNLPPDEINIIRQGNFGWPFCYGKQILDERFDASKNCQETIPSLIDIQAHSAPLGLGFFPDEGEHAGDLLVAFHGSWNRSVPTGYKLVRYEMTPDGNVVSETPADFVTGWLGAGNRVSGRPVDVLFDEKNKTIFISDDFKGAIYKIVENR